MRSSVQSDPSCHKQTGRPESESVPGEGFESTLDVFLTLTRWFINLSRAETHRSSRTDVKVLRSGFNHLYVWVKTSRGWVLVSRQVTRPSTLSGLSLSSPHLTCHVSVPYLDTFSPRTLIRGDRCKFGLSCRWVESWETCLSAEVLSTGVTVRHRLRARCSLYHPSVLRRTPNHPEGGDGRVDYLTLLNIWVVDLKSPRKLTIDSALEMLQQSTWFHRLQLVHLSLLLVFPPKSSVGVRRPRRANQFYLFLSVDVLSR